WEMHPISEPSIPPNFTITVDSLKAMKADKVPDAVVEKLASLQDRKLATAQELLDAAGKVLSKEELEANKAKLQQHGTIPGKPMPGTFRFSHGLGTGDINGDGKLDVIVTEGWWEQPAKDEGKPWAFHPAKLGDACADMFAYDLDGDGKADVISSSAHQY